MAADSPLNMDKVISFYRTLSQIPILSSAKILKNGSSVMSVWTERNLERNKSSKILFTQEIDKDFNTTSESSFGVDISNELIAFMSPSERFRGLVRDQRDYKDAKKQYLEIWENRYLTHCVDLPALEIHGDVYTDGEFGCFSWNGGENKIAYIAERKLAKSEPFYKRKPIKKSSDEAENENPVKKGAEYEYKQEWGEQLEGKHLSSIVLFEIEGEKFTVIDWLPESWCPGQVSWAPDDSIVGLAWETDPRRLGLIFCTNRPSYIFHTTVDGKYRIISEAGKAVRSPRFSSDFKYLIWLQRDVGGPHHACHQLVKTSWPLEDNPKIEVIVDIVAEQIQIESGDEFTGIYSQAIVKRAFSNDGKRVVISTPQRNEARTYVIDTETKKITDISDKSIPGSTAVIDVFGDIILASRSSLKQPPQLIAAKLPPNGSERNIQWKLIDSHPVSVPEPIRMAKVEYLDLKHDNDDSTNRFSAIFIGSGNAEQNPHPLVVYPHGGPHSGFINSYSIESALYCLLGYSMIQINYRGSTGAGNDSVYFLPGKVGSADVKDCILAADEAIKRFPVNKDKCVLLGRSHGGFLVTHLSGQYPERFKAVVAGNPVIDVASMFGVSDIPDWSACESGDQFNEVGPVTDEFLLKMRKVSPIVHAHKVKAPTLLCLGSKDKRVPYFQGIEYYHKIRANGCKARMLVYEDNHALSTGNAEIDHVINSALWFIENIE